MRPICLLFALTILLSTAPASVPAANAQPSPETAPPERFFGAVQSIYNPERALQAGVQWERLIFPWSLIQKDGPNSWSDGYFSDQQIAQEAQRGIQLVGLAIYTPQWASSKPNAPQTTNVPANLYLPFDDPRNHWGQFMFKLAQRYRGQIDTWIVWNEPDLYTDAIMYTWDGSVNDMYQLVKVASQAVKKANPNAKVALPGMTYWWDKENGRPLYLARLLDVAGRDPTAQANGYYFDTVVLHQYGNPLNLYATVQTVRRQLAAFGVERPIWVAETNIVPWDDPLTSIGSELRATMDQQASFMIQAFALGRAAGLERMSVYKMVDERPEGPGELFGLIRNNGTPRPAFDAFRTAIRYMSNPTSAVYTWEGASEPPTADELAPLLQSNARRTQWIWPAAVNRVTLERGTERVTVLWNGSSRTATARVPAATRNAMVVDKYGRDTGEVVAQNGQFSLELAASTNNSDPRDRTAFLVGGEPRMIVERVAPIPRQVRAPIQTVWARDASTANVTGLLLLPDVKQAVPCRWQPNVTLWASVDGGTARDMGRGARRMVTHDGVTYPVWDFDGVSIAAAAEGRTMDLWLEVEGIETRATRYMFKNTPPTPTPEPSAPSATPAPTPTPEDFTPTASCA